MRPAPRAGALARRARKSLAAIGLTTTLLAAATLVAGAPSFADPTPGGSSTAADATSAPSSSNPTSSGTGAPDATPSSQPGAPASSVSPSTASPSASTSAAPASSSPASSTPASPSPSDTGGSVQRPAPAPLQATGPDYVSAAGSDRLTRGQALRMGESLVTGGGRYTLILQNDGNLVLYATGGRPLWHTATGGKGGALLILQNDGNLVLYTAAMVPLWHTATGSTDAITFVLQTDGNMVLYGVTSVRWTSGTSGNLMRAGDILREGQSLVSADGSWTLLMQLDGNLVVYSPTAAHWASNTGGILGSWLIAQADGNVVLYGADNRPYWSSATSSVFAVGINTTGNVVGMGWDGSMKWATGSGNNMLATDFLLTRGQRINSAGGAYFLIMQDDGNLVLYRTSGGAVWSTVTGGMDVAGAKVGRDGYLYVLAPTGRVIWRSNPAFGGAMFGVVGDDGTFVTMTPWLTSTWISANGLYIRYDYPPVTAPPPVSTSRYVRNLRSDASDAGLMRNEGCDDAAANPAGRRYLIILAVGAQSPGIAGGWGVYLTATSVGISNVSLLASLQQYVDGYASCRQLDTQAIIAVGTNNDSSSADARTFTGGQIFAQQLINPLASYSAKYGSAITIAGANDIEPGFKGSEAEGIAWTQQFLLTSSQPYVFFGSADGCPYQSLRVANGTCNRGYTQWGLYQMAYGLAPDRMIAVPQIYTSQSLPYQWANISLTGAVNGRPRVAFGGPLTEVTACAQAGSCASVSAVQGWNSLWSALNADARTAVSSLPYATDLRIDSR